MRQDALSGKSLKSMKITKIQKSNTQKVAFLNEKILLESDVSAFPFKCRSSSTASSFICNKKENRD